MMTTLKAKHTSHMELRCNHPLGHKMCAGRRRDTGAPHTRETAAYTYDLCAMIIGAAANVTGRHEALTPLLQQSNAAFEKALVKYHVSRPTFRLKSPKTFCRPSRSTPRRRTS